MSDVDNTASNDNTSESPAPSEVIESEVVTPVPDAPAAVVEAVTEPVVEVVEVPEVVADVASEAEPEVAPVVEAADAAESAVVGVAAVEAEVVPDPASFRYQPGDIIPGTISQVGPNGIEADLGDGDTGVIPRAEIEGDPDVGQAIEGLVMKHQAGTGRYVISPKRATKSVHGSRLSMRSRTRLRSPARLSTPRKVV